MNGRATERMKERMERKTQSECSEAQCLDPFELRLVGEGERKLDIERRKRELLRDIERDAGEHCLNEKKLCGNWLLAQM